MNLLILGGSGQLSGRVAALALAQGHQVWTLTRGLRPLPVGVHALTADRNDDAALSAALEGANTRWEACIDCTGRSPESAAQCVKIVSRYTGRFVVVSTDSVYHPAFKTVPQDESNEHYLTDGGYGATKRLMEEVFIASALNYTIFRPGHIYGAGFQLGCYPEHTRQADLLAHIRAGKPLRLVGGGAFLIHPIHVDDLALTILDAIANPACFRQIFCIGGPDVVTNADYYRLVGRIIGVEAQIETIPLEGYLEAHPEYSGHLCNRCYDLTKLRAAGLRVPDTSLEAGLREQIAWLEH